jgi:hypothetical protein
MLRSLWSSILFTSLSSWPSRTLTGAAVFIIPASFASWETLLLLAGRITCAILVVVAICKTIAIVVHAVATVGLHRRWRSAVVRAAALILTWTAGTIAAERRRTTVYLTIVAVFSPLARIVTAAEGPSGRVTAGITLAGTARVAATDGIFSGTVTTAEAFRRFATLLPRTIAVTSLTVLATEGLANSVPAEFASSTYAVAWAIVAVLARFADAVIVTNW